MNDRLTAEECLHRAKLHLSEKGGDERAEIYQQLADAMKENERLREALKIIATGTYMRTGMVGTYMQTIDYNGIRRTAEEVLPNKESE